MKVFWAKWVKTISGYSHLNQKWKLRMKNALNENLSHYVYNGLSDLREKCLGKKKFSMGPKSDDVVWV